MTESQFKKILQSVCIGAVTVFFIMMLVLIILFSQKAAKTRSIKNLNEQIARAEQVRENLTDDIEYYKTMEFVEAYAREHLDMIKRGEQKYKVK